MSRGLAAFCFLVVVLVGIALMNWRPDAPLSAPPDTAYARVSETSAAVAETTSLTVARFTALRDSLRRALRARRVDTVRDTTINTTYVTVENFLTELDTVFINCERCAEQLREHRRFTDSAMKSKDDTIYALRRRLEKCKGSRPWWAAVGLGVGAVACRAP